MNLDVKICPGCGKLDPVTKGPTWFECELCGWSSGGMLPTLRQMVTDPNWSACDNVNLSDFLGTLLKDEL